MCVCRLATSTKGFTHSSNNVRFQTLGHHSRASQTLKRCFSRCWIGCVNVTVEEQQKRLKNAETSTVVDCGFNSSCLETFMHLSPSICHPSVIHPSNQSVDSALNAGNKASKLQNFHPLHQNGSIQREKIGGWEESSGFQAGSSRSQVGVMVWAGQCGSFTSTPTLPAASLNLPGLHGNAASLSSPNSKPESFTDILLIPDLI